MTPESSQSPQEGRPRVITTIPCFDTEPFIADVVCKAKKYADQVIVVDNGSHARPAEALRIASVKVMLRRKEPL